MIAETLRQEEERFRRTLGRGMSLLEEAAAGLPEGGVLSGETAFKLYDTYGFPLDLTQDAVRAKGVTERMETAPSYFAVLKKAASKGQPTAVPA